MPSSSSAPKPLRRNIITPNRKPKAYSFWECPELEKALLQKLLETKPADPRLYLSWVQCSEVLLDKLKNEFERLSRLLTQCPQPSSSSTKSKKGSQAQLQVADILAIQELLKGYLQPFSPG